MTRPVVLVVVLVLLAAVAACGDDDDAGGALPAVDGTTVPEAYRIVYEVTTPDSTGAEERVVHRPFEAHIIERDAEGEVTAERWSTLGQLVTRSQGGEEVRIDTAVAPAASDVRPDLFLDPLEQAGKQHATTEGQIGGRPCHRAKEAAAVLTAPDPGATGAAGERGALPVVVERCVDDQGLVLEERWTTAGGQRVLTKRAVELELGDDVPDVDIPDAPALPDEQGNGAVEEIDEDVRPPFVEAWALPAPDGFTFVGRYAVVPARLSATALTGDPGIALYTDVWRRGPDVLLLDQGATDSGTPPFDERSTIGPIELGGIGAAVLAMDLRIAEVRLARPDGGFVRVAGTVAPDELVALARTLEPLGAAP